MTENGAMSPSSTEMGLYIAHHSSRYFVINPVSEEQIRDYAARRGLGEEAVRSALGKYASDK